MDYSLYLVVEKAPKQAGFGGATPPGNFRNWFRSEDGKQIYYLGIIDYLQNWNQAKKTEQWFKTRLLCQSKEYLSAVEPRIYQKRWYDFMEE
jgi:1-phosphatidylinositol-4-phosphate 5-kinase